MPFLAHVLSSLLAKGGNPTFPLFIRRILNTSIFSCIVFNGFRSTCSRTYENDGYRNKLILEPFKRTVCPLLKPYTASTSWRVTVPERKQWQISNSWPASGSKDKQLIAFPADPKRLLSERPTCQTNLLQNILIHTYIHAIRIVIHLPCTLCDR